MDLRGEDLTRRFGDGPLVVKEASLTIAQGELCSLVGPNGAGKSTLLKMLSGALLPSNGQVWLGKRNMTKASVDEYARAGVVRKYQTPSLFDSLSVKEHLSLGSGARVAQSQRLTEQEILERIGLERDARVGDLSFGQRQRLEIALVLMTSPRFLLLDEPSAGLSAIETDILVTLLRELPSSVGTVLIEHDLDLVARLGCRVLTMRDGKLQNELNKKTKDCGSDA